MIIYLHTSITTNPLVHPVEEGIDGAVMVAGNETIPLFSRAGRNPVHVKAYLCPLALKDNIHVVHCTLFFTPVGYVRVNTFFRTRTRI